MSLCFVVSNVSLHIGEGIVPRVTNTFFLSIFVFGQGGFNDWVFAVPQAGFESVRVSGFSLHF